jgi:hypothetical protein
MSWKLYHCVTEPQFISQASLYGSSSIQTLDLKFMSWVLYHCATEAQFISQASLYGKGSIPTLDLRIMSKVLYHCATEAQFISQASLCGKGSIPTLDLGYWVKWCTNKLLGISILQGSPYARGNIQTLDLRIMSRVFYHCAAKTQSI